jgi:phosphohistidine phosphatase
VRKLLLLRHAKSSWDEPGLGDFERPLSARGERAAVLMGVWLAQEGLVPELVLCSPAVRTRDTLRRLLPALSPEPAVRFAEDLYAAEPAAILRRVAGVDDAVRCVLVLGHNPGLEELAGQLARDATALRGGLPTAALVELDLEAEAWREVRRGTARRARVVRPKELV